ncbi:hypothetical protein SHIRM173S_02154 [Streptomyces hirsutus]
MRLLDQLAAGLLVHGVGQLDAQRHRERETLALLADADLGGHRGVGDVHLRGPADQPEGAAETGRVTGGEQLLRVGALAVAAQLHGGAEAEVQLAVGGDGAAVAAVGGGGDSGVERVHGETFPFESWSWGGRSRPRVPASAHLK